MPYTEEDQFSNLTSAPMAILSIYTKSGNGILSNGPKWGITNFKLYGFERVREFYSPKYDGTDNDLYDRDERATLQWNPKIVTDSLGKANVSFYNSDVAKKIRLDIAGFSNTGIPGAETITNYNKADSLARVQQQALTKNSLDAETQVKTFGHISNAYQLSFIGVKNKDWSTVSNLEGDFDIDTNKISNTDTLLIESPGYGIAEITVKKLIDKGGEIELSAQKITPISELEAKDIIKKFIKYEVKNTHNKPYFLKGAYRECILQENDLYRVTDFSLYQRKEVYGSTMVAHCTMPLNGNVFSVENYSVHIKQKPLNFMDDLVPAMDPLNKGLTCLDKEHGKEEYDYLLDGEVNFRGRTMYKISFDQKEDVERALLKGYMLIDKETFGLAYINWRQSDKGKKYEIPQMFLMPTEKMEGFERLNENNEAFYTLTKEGFWKLKMASQTVSLKINNTQMTYNRDFEVIENLDEKPKGFKCRLPEKMEKRTMLVKDVTYNPADWREAWCLPAEEYIHDQIKYLHEVRSYK
jgi:hypothetical protein